MPASERQMIREPAPVAAVLPESRVSAEQPVCLPPSLCAPLPVSLTGFHEPGRCYNGNLMPCPPSRSFSNKWALQRPLEPMSVDSMRLRGGGEGEVRA